jgi:hypothetical protein
MARDGKYRKQQEARGPSKNTIQWWRPGKAQEGGPNSTITHSGMASNPSNAFLVLDTYEDDVLENIASECDIKLGENSDEAGSILSAMRAEEIARAAMAEAAYQKKMEEKLMKNHTMEGENLMLEVTANNERGVESSSVGGKVHKTKSKGSRLERELRRISIK